MARYANPDKLNLDDDVVAINRITKVVKGGRRLRFSALVVIGDRKGHVGFGIGKAQEVPAAISKGSDKARKHIFTIPLVGTTIPHKITGVYGGGKVLLKPAREGSGVTAGGAVRAVMELAGINDITSKSLGSSNPINVIRATFAGLTSLKDAKQVAALRGVSIQHLEE